MGIKTERAVVLILTALENLLHAGIVIGWPSLVYVLKDMGYYSDLCQQVSSPSTSMETSDGTRWINATATSNSQKSPTTIPASESSDVCEEQDAELVLAYTVSMVTLPISMLPVGFVCQKGGIRVARIAFTLIVLLGYVCLALSSPEVPELLYPALICQGTGGLLIIISSFEVSNLFPQKKSTVIGVMNGCYDTSSLILFLVKIAYDNGVSLQLSVTALAITALFFNVSTALLPKDHIPWPLPPGYRLSRPCSKLCGRTEENAITSNGDHPLSREVGVQSGEYNNDGFDVEEKVEVSKARESLPEIAADAKRKSTESREEEAEMFRNKEYPSLASCLKNPMFVCLCFWGIIIQVQMFFVVGIMNPWLTWLSDGDLDVVSRYTNLLAIFSLLSLVGAPLSGLLLDRKKLKFCRKDEDGDSTAGPMADLRNSCLPIALTTCMSLIYTVCMLIPYLPLQPFTFAMLTLCRSTLYCVSAGVVPVTFPMQYYAIIYGMLYMLIGVVGFVQYPLFILMQEVLDGDPTYVLVGFLAANVATFLYPAYILYYVKKRASVQS
ncbi:equilibrative nucleobase transporter 1-like [Diadema antillarum]|uniref:equilibrative nucleobase transporter 1-like n=1 Tax=Diadema antillarum TaxID=105358 RepID=UPI003A8AE09A